MLSSTVLFVYTHICPIVLILFLSVSLSWLFLPQADGRGSGRRRRRSLLVGLVLTSEENNYFSCNLSKGRRAAYHNYQTQITYFSLPPPPHHFLSLPFGQSEQGGLWSCCFTIIPFCAIDLPFSFRHLFITDDCIAILPQLYVLLLFHSVLLPLFLSSLSSYPFSFFLF